MALSTTTPPHRYTYNSRIVRCEYRARHTRATVPVRTIARHEGRKGHGNGKAHDTRRGQQQGTNETTMKEQRKRNERRTTKTNDNSKISEVNGSNEPCRGMATPIIFLYMDIGVYKGRHPPYIGCLPLAKYTLRF